MIEPEAPEPSEAGRECPWCAAPAVAEATRCSACGAALAQRESIANLMIPGLTAVDPALVDFDKRPLHLRGPSPSQGMAPGLIVAAAAGGPIGLLAIGGVAAVVAGEYLTTQRDGPDGVSLEDVGKPSEVVLQALEHLEDGTLEAAPDAPAAAGSSAAGATGAAGDAAPASAPDDGLSIWRDLPRVDASLSAPEADPLADLDADSLPDPGADPTAKS